MSVISKVIEVTVKINRFIKLLKFGDSDTINAYLLSSFGNDFNPPKDYKALYIKTSNSNEPVCIGFINKVIINGLNAGDNQIFSTNEAGDTLAAYLRLLNDGTININGNTDNIAGFAKLKEGFDQAISDLNTLTGRVNDITTLLKTWIPVPQDGGTALQLAANTQFITDIADSEAAIDESKKDNILIE